LERATKGEFELIATTNVAGRDRASEAWNAIPIVAQMRRDGRISDNELRAAQILYRNYRLGMQQPGLTVRYQPRIDGSNGTSMANRTAHSIRRSLALSS
jgi:hypothetical protein